MHHAPRVLLVTDVVDSTRLAEQLGDVRVAALWTAHDRVARELLVAHDGREIDKTDGFLLLFDDVGHALAYAHAYHAALASLDTPLLARAGLHHGPVVLRENAPEDVARGAKPLEVDGAAKAIAARVMSVARGGQTLLTAAARQALGGAGADAVSHGHWRMKGVEAPLELFEVAADGAPMAPPPDAAKVYRVVRSGDQWLPVRQVRHSLPAERDAFVGRDQDLRELARRVDDGARLVSVLGIGGTGKTRLVTRFGWTWLGDWPGGVWFCDLADARTVDSICSAVAAALDVPLGRDPVAQLGHALAGHDRCLVILDNFEQITRHAGATVGPWLDRAPQACFVVTSREVLGLPGETTLHLPPLDEEQAMALFAARARQVHPDLVLADDDPDVRALVRLLDRLPLAIELAAARARVMSPKTLCARMSQRFRLLATASGRVARQATLEGALDWSWDLLSPDERSALAQLSVFEGGIAAEAAAEVLDLGEMWPEDALQSLVDKSLVRPMGDERFGMLVSVQEYAARKLDGAGERAEAEARHGAWCGSFGTDAAMDALDTGEGVARRRVLAREFDNIVAACRRAVERGDGAVAAGTVRAAWAILALRGPVDVGVALLDAAIGVDGMPPAARAEVLRCAGLAHQDLGHLDQARTHFDAALALAQTLQLAPTIARCQTHLAVLARYRNDPAAAETLLDAAIAVAHGAGARVPEAQAVGNLALLRATQGRAEDARAGCEASIALVRAVGDLRTEGTMLGNLAVLQYESGDVAASAATHEAALAAMRTVGNRRQECMMLSNLGIIANDQGRHEEALARMQASSTIAREVGFRAGQASALRTIGDVQMDLGRLDEARATLDAAIAIDRDLQDTRGVAVAEGTVARVLRLQGRLDDAEALARRTVATFHELGDPRNAGLVGKELGIVLALQGDLAGARAAFDEAEATIRPIANPRCLAEVLVERAAALVAADPDAAQAAFAEAVDVAEASGSGPQSTLVRRIAEVRALVQGDVPPAGATASTSPRS